MLSLLFIVGCMTLLAGLIMGFMSGTFLGFISIFIGSILSAIIFFSLAQILENQSIIMNTVELIKEDTKKPLETRTCPRCEKEYTVNLTSCPYCAHRPKPEN